MPAGSKGPLGPLLESSEEEQAASNKKERPRRARIVVMAAEDRACPPEKAGKTCRACRDFGGG